MGKLKLPKIPDLFKKSKKVEGRIKVLKVVYYRDCPIYLMVTDGQIFQYFAIIKKSLFFGYNVITPRKGKTSLTEHETNIAAALILTGATTTVDLQLGAKENKSTKDIIKTFEKGRKGFDKKRKKSVN